MLTSTCQNLLLFKLHLVENDSKRSARNTVQRRNFFPYIILGKLRNLHREVLHWTSAATDLSASAASAFTISRYFSTASLPENPLVL